MIKDWLAGDFFFYPGWIVCVSMCHGEGRQWQDYFSKENAVQFPCIFHVDPHDFGIGMEEIIENIRREIIDGFMYVWMNWGMPFLVNHHLCIRKLFLTYGHWSL